MGVFRCQSIFLWRCLLFILFTVTSLAQNVTNTSPLAVVTNGTYQGRYISQWDQDVFLGIPFAQPPVGQLRFKWPQSLNSSFTGTRSAEQYGYSCYQVSTPLPLTMSIIVLDGPVPSSRRTCGRCSRTLNPLH